MLFRSAEKCITTHVFFIAISIFLAMELVCGNIHRLLHQSDILLQNLCSIATKKDLMTTKLNYGDIPGLLPRNVMSLH